MFQVTAKLDDKKLDDLIFALQAVGANRLPGMADAVRLSTSMVMRRWIENSKGAFKRPSGGADSYMMRIEKGMTYPFEGDIYKGAVINNSPHARWIEEGTKRHDMKEMLWTSAKVRISAEGKRYLIIPFRHGTPSKGSHEGGVGTKRATLQTMPQSIYARVRGLTPSYRVASTKTINPVTGAPVIRHSYKWGGRLSAVDMALAGIENLSRRPHWKSSPYVGMVRFPRDGGKSNLYMTFRVMSEGSTGWWHPGTPAMHLAKKTAEQMQPIVVALIQRGFMQDLRGFMGIT